MRFDACAHSYDAYAAPQRNFAARVAEFIEVRPREDVVELGAGTGALTIRICGFPNAGVRATDASPAMAELGRKAAAAARWSVLDAFESAVPEAALQISSGLLQWAAEPREVLRGWGAALKPGGRLVHAFPCDPCLEEWRALVPASPVLWRGKDDWEELFAAAGLRVRRAQIWIEPVIFPSALDMLRALHRSGVTGRTRLGPGRLRQALRDYEIRHQVSGGVLSTWAWLAVEAEAP